MGIARGHAGLDWTALGLIAAEEAGLDIALQLSILESQPIVARSIASADREQDHAE